MRVVAGTARGRALRAPPGLATRPTADRVREAVFSSLVSIRGDLTGARVVDLFSGSGALGIEALSRGAAEVVFVDTGREALATIRANLEGLAVAGAAVSVVARDALAVAGDAGIVAAADVVFADPPYRLDVWVDLASGLVGAGFRGLLVAESGATLRPLSGWDAVRRKAYGSTVVTMLRPVDTGSVGVLDG